MSNVMTKSDLEKDLSYYNELLQNELKKETKDNSFIKEIETQIKNLKLDIEKITSKSEKIVTEKKVKYKSKIIKLVKGFWCEELQKSFSIGYYEPKSAKEYKIIEKYNKIEKIKI